MTRRFAASEMRRKIIQLLQSTDNQTNEFSVYSLPVNNNGYCTRKMVYTQTRNTHGYENILHKLPYNMEILRGRIKNSVTFTVH